MTELPKGWAQVTLDQISSSAVTQFGPQAPEFTYIDISSISPRTKSIITPRQLATSAAPSRARQNVVPDDVLVSLTRPNLNAVAIVGPELTGSIASTGFHVLRPIEIEAKYLYFFAQSRYFVEQLLLRVQGVVYPAVRPKDVAEVNMPLPPLPEQRRIVSEIEKQFTRLDASEAILRRAEGRAHVLERELTQPCKLDPHVSGSLPQLPKEWSWTSAQHVCEFITKGTTPAKQHLLPQGDIPYVKVNNLSFTGELNFETSCTFIPREIHERELARSEVLPGDVLMNIVGPPLGKVSSVPATYPRWNINQAIARFRPKQSICPEFLALVLRSAFTLRWLVSMTKATVGQVNLTLETCREIPVPVPPMDEQVRIAQRVVALTSELQVNRKALTKAQLLTLRLRQAILAKAFSGQLAPQDPNDEPASALLDRIRAERAGMASQRSKHSARTKAAVKS